MCVRVHTCVTHMHMHTCCVYIVEHLQDGGYSLQASEHKYQYESSSQTESKKGYLFLYPSLCLSYNDNKHRAMASSFAISLSLLLNLSSLRSNLITIYSLNGLLSCFISRLCSAQTDCTIFTWSRKSMEIYACSSPHWQ